MARAGWYIRQIKALEHAGDKLCECGHQIREHREVLRETYALEDGEIVTKLNPDYEPLHFHCHHDGCDCILVEAAR